VTPSDGSTTRRIRPSRACPSNISRADIEDRPGRRAPDDLYRLTSPVYWAASTGAFVRWVLGTNRGRLVAAGGAVILAIISGAAQAVFTKLMGP